MFTICDFFPLSLLLGYNCVKAFCKFKVHRMMIDLDTLKR